jgi:hypothetical protein
MGNWVIRGRSFGPSGITHGQQINATNTGITALGLTDANLTSQGSVTYSTNGQTITNRLFTGSVNVTGSNITLRGCKWSFAGGSATKALSVTGSGLLVEYCTIAPSSGSWYMGIDTGPSSTIDYCNISGSENNITTYANGVTIRRSYLHDASNASNPSGHRDCIEVYGGATVMIELCRLTHPAGETATLNIAPWSGSDLVSNCTVQDNFIDGGNMHFVVDLQSSGSITNTRVKRNKMGGHTDPNVGGRYWALNDVQGRGTVENEAALSANPNAILWPTSGADRNTWDECSDLSPDRTGQTVVP